MVWPTVSRRIPGHGFVVALSFLTRIPVRHNHEPNIGSSAPWFPVVGVAVGAIVGAIAWGVSNLTSPLVGAAVGVLAGVLITGAFHEDGLADIADAFVGGWSIEDRLRILKDPLHGSYGVAALSGSIVLRIAALGSMKPEHMFVAAIAAHCLARTGALVLMLTTALAHHDGLGADYVRTLPIARAFLGIIFALVIGFIALDVWVIAAVVATIVGASVIRWWAQRKIGGITGDVLGAAEQISEALIYVALSAR
jgi:adenosylcobinamide-GDP ribazoletransferase